jgi:alkylation response protein AidB-like acyl-CoA dehydrogenase
MNFRPTEEQHAWQTRAERLAREVLAPRAAALDAQACLPHENLADLRREGFLRLAVPRHYGGLWVDHVTYALAMIALGIGCAATTGCLAMHFGCVFHILAAGSRAQKERMLAWAVEEGVLFAIAGTDAVPDASSPPGVVVARRAEGSFRLTGQKYFVTGAGVAGAYVVRAAREEEPAGAPPSIFVVRADSRDDLRVEERWDGLGLRGSASNDVIFQETWVPEEDLLGACAEPEPLCFQPTAGFSIGLAAWPLGTAIAALEYALAECGFPTTGPQVPGTPRVLSGEKRRLLAEMKMKIDAARWMLLHAAWVADTDPDNYLAPLQAARFTATKHAVEVAQCALLVAGGRGYLARNPLERLIRDALAGPLQGACHETCPDRVAADLLRTTTDH